MLCLANTTVEFFSNKQPASIAGDFDNRSARVQTMEIFPNSSLAGCQAILMLDMLRFSYCHIECQNLIQMQLKIQIKL